MNRSVGSSSLNLSSQRISFVNKIGLILKATADDESVTPGYMHKEINDISFESVGYSESLVEFLVDRLIKNSSCNVKFKVLKLIKHIFENGSQEFRLGIRRYTTAIQECTKFGGPPHPMHGNTPYLMVRKIATEVCESLYSLPVEGVLSPAEKAAQEKQLEPKYGGLGPVRSGGTIQGFGNTQKLPSKGLGETILDGLEKLSAKMSEKPSDRQAALLASIDLAGAGSSYQPPVISAPVLAAAAGTRSLPSPRLSTPTTPAAGAQLSVGKLPSRDGGQGPAVRRPAKMPTPGKAGGGWGDDDDDDDEDDEGSENVITDQSTSHVPSVKHSSFETDSLADAGGLLCSPERGQPVADCSQELDLLSHALAAGSTGVGGEMLAPSQVDAFLEQAARVNFLTLAEMLAGRLPGTDLGMIVRCLQLLEGFIHHKEELVPIESLSSSCFDALVSCFLDNQPQTADPPSDIPPNTLRNSQNNTAASEPDSERQDKSRSATPAGEDNSCSQHASVKGDNVSDSTSPLQTTIVFKSAKLILTLQQMSGHKEILPAENLKSFMTICLRQVAVST